MCEMWGRAHLKCKATTSKCCNCGGDHSAAYRGCEVQKQAQHIQRYKIDKTTYADAVKECKKK